MTGDQINAIADLRAILLRLAEQVGDTRGTGSRDDKRTFQEYTTDWVDALIGRVIG